MPRMDESKRLSKPLTALRIEDGKNSGEICLIFGARYFSFVQKLEFWGEIRDTIRCSVSNSQESGEIADTLSRCHAHPKSACEPFLRTLSSVLDVDCSS